MVSSMWRLACEEAEATQDALTVATESMLHFTAYLRWFESHSFHLQDLAISGVSLSKLSSFDSESARLPLLLASAAQNATKLQTLVLENPGDDWQKAVGKMTQLSSLLVNGWYVPWPGGCQARRGSLSGLTSLKVYIAARILQSQYR